MCLLTVYLNTFLALCIHQDRLSGRAITPRFKGHTTINILVYLSYFFIYSFSLFQQINSYSFLQFLFLSRKIDIILTQSLPKKGIFLMRMDFAFFQVIVGEFSTIIFQLNFYLKLKIYFAVYIPTDDNISTSISISL